MRHHTIYYFKWFLTTIKLEQIELTNVFLHFSQPLQIGVKEILCLLNITAMIERFRIFEQLIVLISSVTFGIGHIINLFAGQASLETVIQVFFAVAWGFIFTFVFYKCGSLIPCIIAHSLIDVFSLFVNESHNDMTGRIYIGVTIAVAIVYGIYLAKQPGPECAEE